MIPVHGTLLYVIDSAIYVSLPSCTLLTAGSQYYWQAYSTWRRVTVMLPSQALVGSVAFKLTSSSSYPWAVRNLYIGSCPGGCSGHGDCTAQGEMLII